MTKTKILLLPPKKFGSLVLGEGIVETREKISNLWEIDKSYSRVATLDKDIKFDQDYGIDEMPIVSYADGVLECIEIPSVKNVSLIYDDLPILDLMPMERICILAKKNGGFHIGPYGIAFKELSIFHRPDVTVRRNGLVVPSKETDRSQGFLSFHLDIEVPCLPGMRFWSIKDLIWP